MQNILFIIKAPFVVLFSTVVIIGSIINGSIDINIVPNKFDIGISNVKIDGEDINDSVVNKNTLIFTTGDLKRIGDSSVLEYEITNRSSYDASLSMKCTKTGKKSDYYTITDTTPEIIKSGDKSKAYLTVTLVKESLTDSYENFSCELDATVVQGR